MQKYYIRIGGGISVRQIEFYEDFASDEMAIKYVERSLRYYHPVYFEASLCKTTYSDGCTFITQVAHFKARVVVEVSVEKAEKEEAASV